MLRRPLLLCAGLLSVGALTATLVPASAAEPLSDHLLRPLAGPDSGTFPGSEVPVGDLDARGPVLPPLAGATAAVRRLGKGVEVSWNQYGTPRTMTRPGGYLAEGLAGTPLEAARSFLRANAALVGLTAGEVDALEVVSDRPLTGSPAHAVLLRQRAGGLPLAEDGLITIGVRDGKVAILTGSAVGRMALNTTTPSLSAAQGVRAAARDLGLSQLQLGDLTAAGTGAAGFSLFDAAGLAQQQRTRLRVLPTTGSGLRLVWETAVQDVAGGRALAAASFVDAVTGKVLVRRDAVDTAAVGTQSNAGMRSISLPAAQAAPSGGSFQGAYTATACSKRFPLAVPAGTRSIVVAVASVLPANDITFKVYRGSAAPFTQDLLTSPEAASVPVEPASRAGEVFSVEVCPFSPDTVSAPFDFVGAYGTSSTPVGTGALPGLPNLPVPGGTLFGPPTFRAFGANPTLPVAGKASPDDRQLVCGGAPGDVDALGLKDLSKCNVFSYDDASPFPYDVEATTGLPSFATIGNNAVTTNAQASSSLTPGAPGTPATSPTRAYAPAFTDAWNTSRCDPLQTIGRADVDAATTNLFTGHNLVHDFAYRLGLVEQTGALQVNNFGKGGAEGDPEVGNVQNAAATNPTFPVVNQGTVPASGIGLAGRNNANQITLQDGVPGITNQYLFEPVLGFFGPCADGDLDASIFLHEYTHAISNRLVAGPDTGLSGEQAGAMGESWSDLVAVEYLQAFDLAGKRGEDAYSVGAYATGDTFEGIRDYNLRPSANPLNYSSYGFDTTGPEVHADGEIWNAAQMQVRQALSKAYDGRFPSTNKALQKQCALGHKADGTPASTFAGCPGNRRWVTYLFDAMILQASGSPTMVDMKDSMLAADMLRTKGVDRAVIADAYAVRGLGAGSKAVNTEDTDPTPSFASPTAARNAVTTFSLVDATTAKPVAGSVFVGDYQARATPIATTLGGKNPDATAPLLAGTYDLLVQAKGYGLQRFTQQLTSGTRTVTLPLLANVASATKGAKASGTDGVRLANVIDDNEATNGGFDGAAAATPIAGRTVEVDLAGGLNRITKVSVSALHHPVDAKLPGDFQGRLLGIRAFDLQASKDGGKTYSTVYKSPADFFPVDLPRGVAPDLNLRTVTLPQPVVADHLRLVVRSNACTGATGFQGSGKNAVAEALAPTDCAKTVNAQRVTITELEAFGVAASGPATGTLARPVVVRPIVARPSGDSLPTTGAPVGLAILALGLLGGAAAVTRRRA